ncbi:DUF3455 domain-containing protein [Paraburkholderia sp. NMBU_R16]|uniref:DUF3455 domain-containing protein n=1 Tax=Paraburkholderia sp. NMBU_R16 TaxID=2698676 RepID=UPI001563953E|nr:DUF3455 domain-containing protein [Paraburkholderia sp. NMBU_R16]NRO99122.1 DUF3455 domain-containing protein [Paraburkholderia sp. NMBU_R16]
MLGAAYADEGVPTQLVPTNAQPLMSTKASGVQVYTCEFDRTRHLAWVLDRPDATLYDAAGHEVVRHGKGPSWQAHDGSKIIGHVVAQAASAHPDSIAQLLLATNAVTSGELGSVRFVQRLDTVGGLPPAKPCLSEHQTGSSPYLARYVFLK